MTHNSWQQYGAGLLVLCSSLVVTTSLCSCNSDGDTGPNTEVCSGPVSNRGLYEIYDEGDLQTVPTDGVSLRLHNATDTLLDAALKATNPRALEFAGVKKVSSSPFLRLRAPERLTRLDLMGCGKLDRRIMQVLSNCSHLEKLNLTGCSGIPEGSFGVLGRLPKLTWLDLSGCNVGDVDLVAMAASDSFQEVDLWACDLISVEGLRTFVRIETLRQLDLTSCKQLSGADIAVLQQSGRAGLEIIWP